MRTFGITLALAAIGGIAAALYANRDKIKPAIDQFAAGRADPASA